MKIRFFTRKICASHKLEMRKEAAQEWRIIMSDIKGRIHSVESFGSVDGPDVRPNQLCYVLFIM